jgi:hypothetical protein
VDVAFPISPVDGGELPMVSRGFVEELKDGLDLSELIATLVGVSSHSQSLDPFVSKVIMLGSIVYDGTVRRSSSCGYVSSTSVDDALSEFLSKVRHIILIIKL